MQADIANTSYVNTVRSVQIPSRRTYRYVFSQPLKSEKPYLLFLHGFPESSYGWINQIEYFKRHGYGIIAPDMLGYGGTDNPTDLEAFKLKTISSELVDLLDCEGIGQVVAIGHDFGSSAVSALQWYNPDRLLGLAFMSLGYFSPGLDLPLAAIEALNNQSETFFSYPALGYWPFHNTDEATTAYDNHLDSVYTLWYTNNETYQRQYLAPYNALETWLSEDRQAPYGGAYISEVTKAQWKSIVERQGGLSGGLNWYRANLQGVNSADAAALRSVSPTILKPTLIIVGNDDPVAQPSVQLNNTLPFAPRARIRTLDAGHFVPLQAVEEVNYELHEFLKTFT
ncbi:alpha/beta-hydrolase [Alternaria alternata]|uniref:Alpha/beta-hydrolase n=1 Tax=Alternaria alternata TaxID=5599 RepID=A0A177DRU6_ALTAL|nr:alpha/beta-hydrolase [Alternaria alternata]OAG21851.1 alpha/beta-hydrolase [Alternaria alternata]